MAEATAELGYADTSVADVLRRARVSRATFYELFESKQACFIAAYDQAARLVFARLEREDEYAQERTTVERFDQVIGIYLQTLAAEPAFARLFMVEVYCAGEEVLARRDEIQRRFEDLLIERAQANDERTRFACRALVAAVITLVTSRLAARDPEGLRALHRPLVELFRDCHGGR